MSSKVEIVLAVDAVEGIAEIKRFSGEAENGFKRIRGSTDPATSGITTLTTQMRAATFTLRQMGAGIVGELNPALGQTVSTLGMAGAAGVRMGLALGVVVTAATVAAQAISGYIRNVNTATERQAALNVAARAFDAGPMRQEMAAAAVDFEKLRENTKTLMGQLSNLFRGLFGEEWPWERRKRAADQLSKVLPIEREQDLAQRYTDEKRVLLDLTRIEEQRAEQAGDVQRLTDAHKRLSDTLVLEAEGMGRILDAQEKLAIAEATSRFAKPDELKLIGDRFALLRKTLGDRLVARLEGAQAGFEQSRGNLLAQRSEALSRQFIPAPEDLGEIDQGLATLSRVTFDLEGKLHLASREAQVFGSAFDELSARTDAARQAIEAYLKMGLEPTDARIQSLKKGFDALRTVTDVRTVFTDTFSAFSTGLGQAVAETALATRRIDDAFAEMGKNVAATLIQGVINKAIQPLQDSLSNLIVSFAKLGVTFFGGLGTSQNVELQQLSGPGAEPAQHGAIVKAKPGGRLMLVAEGGEDEAIVPLSRLGGGSNVEINIIQGPGTDIQRRDRRGPNGKEIRDLFVSAMRDEIGRGTFDRDMSNAWGLSRRGAVR